MPNIRNKFNLSEITWFKVGGLAENFARPSTVEELLFIIKNFKPITLLGNTSNVLISDRNIKGCVIKLGSAFGKIEQITETKFRIGAACLDITLSKYMQNSGISGTEFLATIPGTLGGNICMNAGCFGSEIFDILESIEILQPDGTITNIQKNEIEYMYRFAKLPSNTIILSAILNGVKSTSERIQNTINQLTKQRLESQPINVRTGGSTFKNPNGYKAWQLIQESDAHKLKIGGAEVSQKHSNFLINSGGATAKDIHTLGELIRQKVLEKTGINLEWEIKQIGDF
jgi:UDP-N-acetylmuramate dehydrogenase